MYDVVGKLLGGIKSMYVDSSAYIRVKVGESERFRVDSVVKQECVMSPWLFNVYMDAVMKEVNMRIGRKGESGDYQASCMQINSFYVESRRRTRVRWWDGLLRYA